MSHVTTALIALAVLLAWKVVGWFCTADDPWSYIATVPYLLGLREEP